MSTNKTQITEEIAAKLRKYFTFIPTWVGVIPLVGLMFYVIPGIIAVGVIWYLYMYNKPTDAEIDQLTETVKDAIKERSYKKIGLDESETVRDPEIIVGPSFTSDVVFNRGKDKKVRCSVLNSVVLQFTKNYLAIYSCKYDMKTCSFKKEATEEYYYKDIASVSTYTDDSDNVYSAGTKIKVVKDGGWSGEKVISLKRVQDIEKFRLQAGGMNFIEVALTSPSLMEQIGGTADNVDIDNVIKAIKSMLREKKG